VAQGGRFGGWSLYCTDGVLRYAYNRYGRDLTIVCADRGMAPGRHELAARLHFDGGPPGGGAQVELLIDGEVVGTDRLEATTAFYFAFDETFNVGVDRGTPVSDDYRPVHNRFSGVIRQVRFDLAPEDPLEVDVRRRVTTLASD
jgi:arylsulfatase